MRLYLIRHGKPAVAHGICYGAADVEVPACEHLPLAAALAAQLPRDTPVWTSPAVRCTALAGALASALGSSAPVPDARLREIDFGAWEMRSWDRIPREEVDAWAADPLAYRPGGGESVMQVCERVASFYADLNAAGAAQAIVVCHAGTIRLLARLHAGLTPAESARAAAGEPHRIGYGELLVLG